MDVASKSIRKARELHWMMQLRTVYPYRLNDRVGDEYKTENTHVNVTNKFPSLPRKFIRVNRGTTSQRYFQIIIVSYIGN